MPTHQKLYAVREVAQRLFAVKIDSTRRLASKVVSLGRRSEVASEAMMIAMAPVTPVIIAPEDTV
jgi:hypothetical protein